MKKIVYIVWVILLLGLVFLFVFRARLEKKQVEKQKCQIDSMLIENQRLDSIKCFYENEIETLEKELLQELKKQ